MTDSPAGHYRSINASGTITATSALTRAISVYRAGRVNVGQAYGLSPFREVIWFGRVLPTCFPRDTPHTRCCVRGTETPPRLLHAPPTQHPLHALHLHTPPTPPTPHPITPRPPHARNRAHQRTPRTTPLPLHLAPARTPPPTHRPPATSDFLLPAFWRRARLPWWTDGYS